MRERKQVSPMIILASYLKGEWQQEREWEAEHRRLDEAMMTLRQSSESRDIRRLAELGRVLERKNQSMKKKSVQKSVPNTKHASIEWNSISKEGMGNCKLNNFQGCILLRNKIYLGSVKADWRVPLNIQ